MTVKLLIHIDADRPPAPIPQVPPKPKLEQLREKVEYAIDCIRLDYDNHEEALQFLRKVYNKLQGTKGFKNDHQVITEMIAPLLSIHGNIPEREDSSNG